MINILYVLILKNKEAFKVGITANNSLVRIDNLSKIYDFDLSESYILKSKNKRVIEVLERQIHTDYNEFHYFFEYKNDGHTEFIKYEHLDSVLSDINYKARLVHLGLDVKQSIKIQKSIPAKVGIESKITSKNKLKNEYHIDNIVKLLTDNKDSLRFNKDGSRIYSDNKDLLLQLFDMRCFDYNNYYGFNVFSSVVEYYDKNVCFLELINKEFILKNCDDSNIKNDIQNIFNKIENSLINS